MATSTPLPAPPVDPIDALVPPPRPAWLRLLVAVVIVGGVGWLGWGWHFGAIRPAPDCCGGGEGTPSIGRSLDGESAFATVYLYNSSSRPFLLEGATAELPGATVLGVGALSEPIDRPFADAAEIGSGPSLRIEAWTGLWMTVRFVPDDCSATGAWDVDRPWGAVTVDLAVVEDPWHPTVGNAHELVVAPATPNGLTEIGALGEPTTFVDGQHPIAVACRLLGR